MANIRATRDGDIIVYTAEGNTSLADVEGFLLEHVDEWVGHPVIWDVSPMEFTDIASTALQQFFERTKSLSEKRKGDKTAIVASDTLAFGMMRMGEVFAEEADYSFDLKIFRTMDAAKEWLAE